MRSTSSRTRGATATARTGPPIRSKLNLRKQPVVTYNRIGRKIDGIVGLVEKLRQDPKAYPRTPKHEQGAEVATYALNFVLDQQDWKAKSPICAETGAVDGIGGIEINLVQTGAPNDFEVEFDCVDPDGFFYDPRSFRLDFSDARFMGVGKWVDADTAKEMFPDKADEIDAALDSGATCPAIPTGTTSGLRLTARSSGCASSTSGTSTRANGATASSPAHRADGGQVPPHRREEEDVLQIHHVLGRGRP
jgi:hypothetical protein